MKFPIILLLLFLASCTKTWHSDSQQEKKVPKKAPAGLEQWSGRADFTESAWQIQSP